MAMDCENEQMVHFLVDKVNSATEASQAKELNKAIGNDSNFHVIETLLAYGVDVNKSDPRGIVSTPQP